MPSTEPILVEILGEKHTVTLPDFACREELIVAWGDARSRKGVALLRVYSAALGLCTRLGRRSSADYAKHRFDLLSYGGEVYGWLRERGVTPAQLAEAAIPVIVAATEATFPRPGEVDAAAKNSEASTAH